MQWENNVAQLDVEYTVEWSPHMETIQVVIDKKLLHATDRAARWTKRNRSALVRDALREHLRQIEIQGKEQRDREGYRKTPQERRETSLWERAAAWPEE
jgi:metal-responsive CopG/Arc/MetJ family transcriptional regulator